MEVFGFLLLVDIDEHDGMFLVVRRFRRVLHHIAVVVNVERKFGLGRNLIVCPAFFRDESRGIFKNGGFRVAGIGDEIIVLIGSIRNQALVIVRQHQVLLGNRMFFLVVAYDGVGTLLQLHPSRASVCNEFIFVIVQNGLVVMLHGEVFHQRSRR